MYQLHDLLCQHSWWHFSIFLFFEGTILFNPFNNFNSNTKHDLKRRAILWLKNYLPIRLLSHFKKPPPNLWNQRYDNRSFLSLVRKVLWFWNKINLLHFLILKTPPHYKIKKITSRIITKSNKSLKTSINLINRKKDETFRFLTLGSNQAT